MTETASLVIKVDSSGADRATRSLDRLDKAAGGSERAASRLGKAWGVALGVLTSAAIVGATRAFVRQADAFANMSARIGLVTKNSAELVKVQRQLFDLSQATSSDLESTTDLYVKLAQSSDDLRGNQALLLRTTELVSKSLVVSGTEAAGAAAVIRQFSQAMGAGALRGDEFISIMENAPRLARAIADGMGVAVGELRDLAKEGKLTSEAIVAAIESQGAAIDREFSKMPLTVSRATQQVKNALQQMIGTTDQAEGASKDLAESIANLARTLESDAVRNGFGALLGFIADVATVSATAIGKMNELWAKAQQFATFAMGGTNDVTDLAQIRYEIEQIEGRLASWQTGGIKEFLAGPDIAAAQSRLAELKRLESMSTMLFGDPSKARVTMITGSKGSLPDSAFRATGGGTTPTTVDPAPARATAEATRELTLAEQENALYQESLNRARGESLEMLRDGEEASRRQKEAVAALVDDLEFERSLIGLSNVEREKAIALRYANVDAASEEGRAIGNLIEEIERAREAEGYVNDLKGGLSDLFMAIGQGSRAASDAFDRMIDNMKRRAADALADRAINGLIEGFASLLTGGGWSGFTQGFMRGWGGQAQGYNPSNYSDNSGLSGMGSFALPPPKGGQVSMAPPTSGGQMQVQVNNYGRPDNVRTREESSRGPDGSLLRKLVIDIAAEDMARGGALHTATKQSFGLRRQGYTRG